MRGCGELDELVAPVECARAIVKGLHHDSRRSNLKAEFMAAVQRVQQQEFAETLAPFPMVNSQAAEQRGRHERVLRKLVSERGREPRQTDRRCRKGVKADYDARIAADQDKRRRHVSASVLPRLLFKVAVKGRNAADKRGSVVVARQPLDPVSDGCLGLHAVWTKPLKRRAAARSRRPGAGGSSRAATKLAVSCSLS